MKFVMIFFDNMLIGCAKKCFGHFAPYKRNEIDVDSDGFSSLHRSVCAKQTL